MGKREYRLTAYPKRTIREKQGVHGDLSNSRVDYTRTERAIFASEQERKNIRINDKFDAWDYRSCKPQEECSAALDVRRHRLPTCRKTNECSWAIYAGINTPI